MNIKINPIQPYEMYDIRIYHKDNTQLNIQKKKKNADMRIHKTIFALRKMICKFGDWQCIISYIFEQEKV